MKVAKMSLSMDPQLGNDVRSAAERAGLSVSSWLAGAAAARLRKQALAEFLARWQAKHGAITADQLARARTELAPTGARRRRFSMPVRSSRSAGTTAR